MDVTYTNSQKFADEILKVFKSDRDEKKNPIFIGTQFTNPKVVRLDIHCEHNYFPISRKGKKAEGSLRHFVLPAVCFLSHFLLSLFLTTLY